MKNSLSLSVVLAASALFASVASYAVSTVSNAQGAYLVSSNGSYSSLPSSMTFDSGRSYTLATSGQGSATITLPEGTVRLSSNTRVRVSPEGLEVISGEVDLTEARNLTVETSETTLLVNGSGEIGVGLKGTTPTTTANMTSGKAVVLGASGQTLLEIMAGYGADIVAESPSTVVAGGSELPVAPLNDIQYEPDNSLIAVVDSTLDPDALNPSNVGTRGRRSR